MTAVRKLHVAALAVLFVQLVNAQQSEPVPDAAPVPPAIVTAKKVFISNAGQDTADLFSGSPERSYNAFYAQIKTTLKTCDIVSSPQDADLILEIALHPTPGYSHVVRKSGLESDVAFRLRILDPKSQTVLWTLYEHPELANFKTNRDKNFDTALRRLVADLGKLLANSGPAQQ